MLKPQYTFLVYSKLSLRIPLDLFFDMRNVLVCFLTFDDLAPK